MASLQNRLAELLSGPIDEESTARRRVLPGPWFQPDVEKSIPLLWASTARRQPALTLVLSPQSEKAEPLRAPEQGGLQVSEPGLPKTRE